MAFTNTLSNSFVWADKGWRKFAPIGRFKRPTSLWLAERATQLDPTNGVALHRLGQLLAEDNEWQKAINAYKTAIGYGYTDKLIYHHLGMAYLAVTQIEEAESIFREAIKVSPHAPWPYLELGKILIRIGRYQEAEHILDDGLKREPDNPWLKNHLNQADSAQARIRSVQQIIENCLVGVADEREWSRLGGESLINFSATQSNIALFQAHLKKFENQFLAHRTLGWLHSHIGQPDEAIKHFQKAGQLKTKELVASKKLQVTYVDEHQRLKPSFFIIGPQKSGTTSLHDWLCRHPKIVSGIEKEVRYWTQYKAFGPDWYDSHFLPIDDKAGFMTGEATPGTIYKPEIAHQLRAAYPEIKLIVLLRDSIERAYSHYMMARRKEADFRSWEEVVELELGIFPKAPLQFSDLIGQHYDYLIGSCLLPYIREWLTVFPAEQMLFIQSESLFSQPQAVVEHIFRFFELPVPESLEFPHKNKGDYQMEMQDDTLARLKEWFTPHDKALKEFLIANAPNRIGDF